MPGAAQAWLRGWDGEEVVGWFRFADHHCCQSWDDAESFLLVQCGDLAFVPYLFCCGHRAFILALPVMLMEIYVCPCLQNVGCAKCAQSAA